MLGHHREVGEAVERRRAAARQDRQREFQPSPNSSMARGEELQRVSAPCWERPSVPRRRCAAASARKRASSSAASGDCTPLRPKPVSHSMSSGTSRPWRSPPRTGRAMTVSLSATTARRLTRVGQLHQPVGLALADDVEGQKDIVADAGVDEDFRLAELLAGEPDRAGRHLHLADRRDLVGLDVRAVGDALRGDHAPERARCCPRAGRAGSTTAGVSRSCKLVMGVLRRSAIGVI